MAVFGSEWNGVLENFGRLSLAEKTAVRLDSSNSTYILQMDVQCGVDPLVAAATSKYEIHVLSRNHLTSKGTFKGHTQQVTGIAFGKTDSHCLFSSSADKTVRSWDCRTAGAKEVQKLQAPSNVQAEILCIDSNQSDHLLCAGTESADKDDTYILFWDRRMGSLLGSYTESHDNDINQICFKPGSDNLLASGSSDGLICTFDLNNTCEDDALLMTFNADADVERIGWCGDNCQSLYCVTTDSSFHTWHSEEGEKGCSFPGPSALSEEIEGVDYVIDCIPEFTAKGKGQDDALLVTGNYKGCLTLLGVNAQGHGQCIKSLPGGHSSTIRCSHWDSKSKSLLSAGEDAFLCLWSVSDLLLSQNTPKSKTVHRGGRKDQDSKKPYRKHKT